MGIAGFVQALECDDHKFSFFQTDSVLGQVDKF
jgi:hypothetical protein